MARSLRATDQQVRQILAVLISERKIRERDARLALAKVKTIRVEKGFAAAVAEARRLAKA